MLKEKIDHINIEIDNEMERINKLLSQLNVSNLKEGLHFLNNQDLLLSEDEDQKHDSQKYDEIQPKDINHQNVNMLQYNFQDISQEHQQEMLLDDSFHKDNAFISYFDVKKAKQRNVSHKSDWINKYLDHRDNHLLITHQQQSYEIINAEHGQYTLKKSNGEIIQDHFNNLKHISQLKLIYKDNLRCISLKTNQQNGQSSIFRITIVKDIRLAFQIIQKDDQICRIIVIQQSDDNQYRIVWGKYHNKSFLSDILLKPGKYILLPLGNTYLSDIQLYLNAYQDIHIQKDYYDHAKTYNLIVKSFQECKEQSRPLSDRSNQSIRKQFTRCSYMDLGLIIQIYENIYQKEVIFKDQERHQEDIQLLFTELYSKKQVKNVFQVGQRITKIYCIAKMPAKLFIPKKRIMLKNRQMQNIHFHSIFK